MRARAPVGTLCEVLGAVSTAAWLAGWLVGCSCDTPTTGTDAGLDGGAIPDASVQRDVGTDATRAEDSDIEDVGVDAAMATPDAWRCRGSKDCPAEAPVCEGGSCVACSDAIRGACAYGEHCEANVCVAGCASDDDCDPSSTARRCDDASGMCVTCSIDSDCPLGRSCIGHACVDGCTGDGRCAPGTNCCGMMCVDLMSNDAHCGACGRACALPNAMARCVSGACAVETCSAGFGDCDGDASTGCEVDLFSDTDHCGACGRACALPNAMANCSMGTCSIARCAPGFGDCDGNPSNGCEASLVADAANCGACGRSCGTGVTCAAGICGMGRLRAGSSYLGYIVADAAANEVYFTQRSPGEIYRMRMDGSGLTRIAALGTGGYGLTGLALTRDALYVSTYDNYSIERIDRATGAVTRLTSTTFQGAGMDITGGTLWITDWGSGSIYHYPLSGGSFTTFTTGLPTRLFGLFLGTGPDDRIYVAAGYSGAVDAGELISMDRMGGDRRRLARQLSYPTQVTADERHVYAANTYGVRGSIARAPRSTLEGGARFIGGSSPTIGVTVAAERLYWTTYTVPGDVRWMGLTPACPARWAVETVGADITLSGGNHTVSGTAPSCAGGVLGSDWRTSGRYYFEHAATRDGGSSDTRCPVVVGVSTADASNAAIWSGYHGNMSHLSRGGVTCTPAGPSTVYVDSGDVVGVAWDADARSVSFFKNGVLAFSCNLPMGVYYPFASHCNGATNHCAGTTNFGEAPFRHSPPSGFGSMCAP